ncbi:RDD family protein [Streptomyces misionensis]|uniref:RDD family protein n=1 Tax=Streptomyces misionensis TaxID=67331 RepID=UPI0036B5274B
MSAPTPAPGDDRPREGYYPDPSIPGYVRYWNGTAWVPGTSRPAPKDGEPLSPPPGVTPAVEETGPHFFDEEPGGPAASGPAVTGNSPGPAADSGTPGPWPAAGETGAATADGTPGREAERADEARQSGQAQWGGAGVPGQARQSWQQEAAAPRQTPAGPSVPAQGGAAGTRGADPRVAPGPAQPEGRAAGGDGTATIPPTGSEAPDPGTFVFRRPVTEPAAARTDDGTMTIRPVPPHQGAAPGFGTQGPVAAPTPATPAPARQSPPPGPGFGAVQTPQAQAPQVQVPQVQASQVQVPQVQASQVQVPQVQAPQPQPPQTRQPAPASPQMPQQAGGQASWAQQVHQLAGGADEQPVAPWKPPVEDPFQAAARRQAAARPAGLGKRFAARLIDSVVVGAVTAAAAVPLGVRAVDHIRQKIDAARLSGHEVTVWLLDGSTGTSLAVVLAVLLLAGVVYEVLPTVKWGRTLGKKLCGLEVRDIEAHEPPTFAPALRRWLVYSVPGLLGIGIVGVLWCLFDRPWHQCWHDKAAHTFVAG